MATLPKWAQQEISRLERDLEYARAKLAAGPEDSDTFADPYSDGSVRPLGKGTTIEFKFGPGWSDKIQVRSEGGSLRINGGTRIAVLPQASNLIEVRVES